MNLLQQKLTELLSVTDNQPYRSNNTKIRIDEGRLLFIADNQNSTNLTWVTTTGKITNVRLSRSVELDELMTEIDFTIEELKHE